MADIEERITTVESELHAIKERNAKVETNKAWETSWFRVASIVAATYIIASLALLSIGNDHPYRNALIPTIGFFLSTQSLPFLKKWWIEKRLKKLSKRD